VSEDRALLAESAREFLDRWSSSSAVRDFLSTGTEYDEGIWPRMAQLGWPALIVPEPYGGLGASLADVAVIATEIGAHTTAVPFLSSAVLATSAMALTGPAACADVLKQLAEGSCLATVAIDPAFTRPSAPAAGIVAVRHDTGLTLRGSCAYVPDLLSADHIVVAARTDADEPLLLLVRADAEGVSRAGLELIDLTRRAGTLTLAGVAADDSAVLARGDAARRAADAVLLRGKIVLAADSVGAANRALTMAVSYAKQRVQFERPIGSFQAIKHKLATMFALTEVAGAGIEQAAEFADSVPSSRLVLSAASYALEASVQVAGDAIQVHGGIGFTWEHDCHLLLKRTLLNEAMLGDVAMLLERIASELLGNAAAGDGITR
jgi:alkylation response protein AidB-like acyl-CoA dehydrogenase